MHFYAAATIPVPPDGNQWAWVVGGSRMIEVDIGAVEADNQDIPIAFTLYTRTDIPAVPSLTIQLWDSMTTIWDSETLSPPSQGNSSNHVVTFNTGTGNLGKTLMLSFETAGNSGQQALIDNVRIVPEPAVLGVVATGLVGVLVRRRRKVR
jgi:hypothetical protein